MPNSTLKNMRKSKIFLVAAGISLFLSGCYSSGSYRASPPLPPPEVKNQNSSAAQIYFYPKAGQTKEQQGRDHYECYNWAVKETGFDPATSRIPADDRVRLVPMPPPGYDTATMAIAGAVLGAILGRRNAAGGAIIGATGGAIIGAASDSARQESVQRQQDAYHTQLKAQRTAFAEREINFRRAMSACLEGRGYSVR